jgi:hypothetical protein
MAKRRQQAKNNSIPLVGPRARILNLDLTRRAGAFEARKREEGEELPPDPPERPEAERKLVWAEVLKRCHMKPDIGIAQVAAAIVEAEQIVDARLRALKAESN